MIGAGVSGALVSYLLARRGWRVLLIEAGGRHQQRGRLRAATEWLDFGLEPWPSNLPERDRFVSAGDVDYPLNEVRLFGVGGTTLHWGGAINRLHEDDFAERSRYGVGADWPLTYAELEPHYAAAERLLGVAGAADADPGSPRSAPPPLAPFPLSHTDRFWEQVCAKVGVSLRPASFARNSAPYDGRPACGAFGTCIPICPIRAQYSADHHVDKALATGRVTLVTDTCVRRILTDEGGTRVTGIVATDLEGRDRPFRANAYVVAAHAVESARLLLLSASRAHPDGLGNRGDQVGRNFMEHWYVFGRVRVPGRRFYPYRVGFDAADSHQFYSRADRDRAGAIKLEFTDRSGTPYDLAVRSGLWGERLAEHLGAEFGRTIGVSAETEHLPYADSRITLHPSEVNAFGDPVPVVALKVGEYERATQRRAAEIITRLLEATGGDRIRVAHRDYKAAHNMGTCRMGDEPGSSVVDRDLRVHGVDNLFVLGSAVFPTAGAAQPTLTIAALAVRLAEHLAESS